MARKNWFEVCVWENRVDDTELEDGDFRTVAEVDTYEEAEEIYNEYFAYIGTEYREGIIAAFTAIYEYGEDGLCEPVKTSY